MESPRREDEEGIQIEEEDVLLHEDGSTYTSQQQITTYKLPLLYTLPVREEEPDEDVLEPDNPEKSFRHFSHRHPMFRYGRLTTRDRIDCKLCSLRIIGKAFGCNSCRCFLHEACFNFPRQIRHSAHPSHPLALVPTRTNDFKCMACGFGPDKAPQQSDTETPSRVTSPLFNFHYRCVPCKFDLHVKCASIETSTRFMLGGNRATLHITFPLGNETVPPKCDEYCGLDVTEDTWVFFNRQSGKIAHFNCLADEMYGRAGDSKGFIAGIRKRLEIIRADAILNQIDGTSDLGTGDCREICHRHLLQRWKPMAEQPPCQLCSVRITTQLYGCKACKYFFHEDCAAIPTKIQHPAHMDHPLVLVRLPDDTQLNCRGCRNRCIQLCYSCPTCQFVVGFQRCSNQPIYNCNPTLHSGCAAFIDDLGIEVAGVGRKIFSPVYSFPYENEAMTISCNECKAVILKNIWMYYNWESDIKYHLHCATRKANLDRGWKESIARLLPLQLD